MCFLIVLGLSLLIVVVVLIVLNRETEELLRLDAKKEVFHLAFLLLSF